MTDEEINQKLVDCGVAKHLHGAGRTGLVKRWRDFVEEVEAGYALGLDDYRNDLDMREVIEDVGLAKDGAVIALDQRLARQLRDTGRAVWQSRHPHAFWIKGYPLIVLAEFLDEVNRMVISAESESDGSDCA